MPLPDNRPLDSLNRESAEAWIKTYEKYKKRVAHEEGNDDFDEVEFNMAQLVKGHATGEFVHGYASGLAVAYMFWQKVGGNILAFKSIVLPLLAKACERFLDELED